MKNIFELDRNETVWLEYKIRNDSENFGFVRNEFQSDTFAWNNFYPFFQRGTLANELERRARTSDYLSPIEVLNIFLQICEAVKAFHEAKPEPLAHRDLKTANILLGDGMTAVVMDLGKQLRINLNNNKKNNLIYSEKVFDLFIQNSRVCSTCKSKSLWKPRSPNSPRCSR